ncbi:MAG: cytochrome P450 [Planctomycetales bacterium]
MATTLRRPPGPKGRFLGGNLAALKKDRLQFFVDCGRDYGDFTYLRFGFHKIILVHSPEAIEQILVQKNRHFRKHFALRLSPKLLGKGLLSSDGDFWLRQRRMAQPAFLPQRLQQYAPAFVDLTRQLLDTWREGEERDFAEDMSGLMLRIATRVLFSSDVTGHEGDVGSALMVAQQHFMLRFNSIVQIPLAIPTTANRQFLAAVKKLDELVYGLIRERRRDPGNFNDLLSLLLHARDEEDRDRHDRPATPGRGHDPLPGWA